MSRSGYSDDGDDEHWMLWRRAVTNSIRGKRGQAFLRELVTTLDAMPEKRLIDGALRKDGEVCAIGSVGAARGVNLEALDPNDADAVATAFGIAEPLVRELEWTNDEGGRWDETPEQRWQRVRRWAESNINEVANAKKNEASDPGASQ